jgi:hypothetical protein
MPPKQKTPAPIDRPLSRAYLREFSGWSTAYPPGLSDPTSLRTMENLLINRDGSGRVRPGLRLVSRNADGTAPHNQLRPLVGTMEPFYLNDGRKAFLQAVYDGGVQRFRVFVDGGDGTLRENTLADHGFDVSEWPGGDVKFVGATYVKYVQIDNKILALSNSGEEIIVFHVGETKKVVKVSEVTHPQFGLGSSTPSVFMPQRVWVQGVQNTQPAPATEYFAGSLMSSDPVANVYNFAFFYTFTNELGETGASDIAHVKTARGFGQWSMVEPGPQISAPTEAPYVSTTGTASPTQAADQLVIQIPAANWGTVISQGATGVNLYMLTWSNQDSVPVEAVLVGTKKLTASTPNTDAWFQIHPTTPVLGKTKPSPTVDNRYNSTKPPRAAQGLVAADRLVLVNDPSAAAVIRWTTNEQGNYLNFDPTDGGGYKTLTSGNLQVPAVAKLWQNPQSADTITVLNSGTDGASTAYYMAPATVTSQSDNTLVMGFEETTATPGTVSPYGCEVANNALYHPLDDQLMKSTASNYNITHKSMTDQIVNKWQPLKNKEQIVSCFFDQRLYFLVYNPDSGPSLPELCMGNEVWVFDLAAENGNWSRFLTPGASLRKLELEGRVYVSLIHPTGVFIFDEDARVDEYVQHEILTRPIEWKIETNTQGANRAHDAWSHLQQVNITVGNFTGAMVYGIRGHDRHGQYIEKKKVLRDDRAPDAMPWDLEDMLLVKKDLKEWRLFAENQSIYDPVGDHWYPQESAGQINLVQYRYTPISVNVGYEHGSVETFVYGRDALMFESGNTTNASPMPMVDTSRP